MKKFEPLPIPRGEGGPCILQGVVEIGGYPYAVFVEKTADMRNVWRDTVQLVPFIEEKK